MIFPYEIAFFNELTGGPQNGYRYLIDSNLDWGQGYKALRYYLLEQDEVSPRLVYQYTYIPPNTMESMQNLSPLKGGFLRSSPHFTPPLDDTSSVSPLCSEGGRGTMFTSGSVKLSLRQ